MLPFVHATVHWIELLKKLFFKDLCRNGPNNCCPGEGARSGKSDLVWLYWLFLLVLCHLSVLVAVKDIIRQPSEMPSAAKLHSFLFDFLDHQSEVCGQNPDRKLWDWCLVLLAISRGLWQAAKVVDLRVLPKVHEVWEDLQISSGQWLTTYNFSSGWWGLLQPWNLCVLKLSPKIKCWSIDTFTFQSHCQWKQPPGKEIYRRSNISVYEVDGRDHKVSNSFRPRKAWKCASDQQQNIVNLGFWFQVDVFH